MIKEKIKRSIVCIVLMLFICVMLMNLTASSASAVRGTLITEPPFDNQEKQAAEDKPAEQVYKNIQVLKGLPASQLGTTMSFIAASLGVRCGYCHVNPWDSDARPAKQTARKMIQMMRDINQANFSNRVAVNCATCHKGQPIPSSIPPLGQIGLGAPKKPATNGAPLPTAEQVFDNYVKALGGKAALDRLKTRAFKVSETQANGTTATVEVYLKAPLKYLAVTTANPPAKGVFVQAFTGERGWGQFNGGRVNRIDGIDLVQATRDAEFYKGLSYFKGEFARITVKGLEKIDDRDVYVIEGMNTEDFREELFFDAKSWLLVRRYGEIKTVLGLLPFQCDYDDYREVDGVKLPFTVRWLLPAGGWTDKITEIKHNVPIADEKFNMPAADK